MLFRSEADILAALIDGKKLENLIAADIMSTEPITVDSDTPMDEVMRLLEESGILRVPVTARGRVVGVISRRDIIRSELERSLLEPEFLTFG